MSKLSLEYLRSEMTTAMKAGNKDLANNYKFLISELQRGRSKQYTDAEIVSVVKKLLASFMSDKVPAEKQDLSIINFLKSLLPETVSDSVVIEWIGNNIDFDSLPNKMAAIKLVIKEFGTRVDGGTVRKIIETKF